MKLVLTVCMGMNRMNNNVPIYQSGARGVCSELNDATVLQVEVVPAQQVAVGAVGVQGL